MDAFFLTLKKLGSHEDPKQIKAWKAARTVRLSYGTQQKKSACFKADHFLQSHTKLRHRNYE